MPRRSFVSLILACGLLLVPGDSRVAIATRADGGLPSKLSDRDFWQLSVDASEPNGYFRSENFTSNELQFQHVIPELISRVRPGRVYLGVGPEQNFTYIAALRPSMAIIFDIRRGNLLLQLMYKALFEMAGDRATFVSLLFSRPRPPGLGPDSTVGELFSKFADVPESQPAYAQNVKAIKARLTQTHHLPLTKEDLDGIQYVYEAFYTAGYRIRYSPAYDDLMLATDEAGVHRSYLATEANFAFMKNLEARNLVVPVVGDFGGTKAIRHIAAYLKAHDATVGAFYLSNVEQYLGGKATEFCRSVLSLPLDTSSTFIRSASHGGYSSGPGFVSSLGNMTEEAKACQ